MSLIASAEQLTVTETRREVVIVQKPIRQTVMVGSMRGPAGSPGIGGADISTDPGNAITTGTDDGIFAPDDIASDPLAYYILAKN